MKLKIQYTIFKILKESFITDNIEVMIDERFMVCWQTGSRTITSDQTVYNNLSLSFWTRQNDITDRMIEIIKK